jgi:CubicO group peptidase (beta-lactamase class C family)
VIDRTIRAYVRVLGVWGLAIAACSSAATPNGDPAAAAPGVPGPVAASVGPGAMAPAPMASGSAGGNGVPATASAPRGMGAMTGGAIGGNAGAAGADAQAAAGSGAGAAASQEWPIGKPEDFGLDSAVLERTADALQQNSQGTRYGMVVIRRGVLVYEKYWNDTGADDAHIVYSCTKSWGSTLIGIAVAQELLSVEDPVTKWVPEPVAGVADGALVKHLLTQTAGSTPPGNSFRYNSGYIINTLPEILEAASGMTGHEFYERYLAAPLGLTQVWAACPAGGCAEARYREGFIQFGDQPPEAPNEDILTGTVRDQAKLGWLWANGGKWNGQQLIDPAYLEAASHVAIASQNYGYLWWIENDEQFMGIGGTGECWIDVMPSRELVIAVLGIGFQLGGGGSWAVFQPIVDSLTD